MILLDKIVPLLPHVARPIQYVGAEVNAVRKPWDETGVKIALCFPDSYEIGMSHLGLHLLYQVLNAETDVLAERIYAPAVDMEALMRMRDIPLFSLESHRAAAEFDLIGFTLQYELSASNILNMLSLAGIPFSAKDRSEDFPLLMAGGPCACNPEPLADFFDFVVIGDGERIVPRIVERYRDWKTSGAGKQEFLKVLCALPGIYVPSFYEARYHVSGEVAEIVPMLPDVPESVQQVIEPDLDALPYLSAPLVPYLKTIHDRLTLEVMRGCPRGCRFCQAGFIYRPKRERSPEYLLQLAQSLLAKSGYDETSLSSLSTGDYSQIASLMEVMMQHCETSRVALSLPSMRVSTLTEKMAAVIRRVRKTGFTIAPEAGSQRLRNAINKGISEADILQTAEEAFASGWDLLKLYFMIGLPTETEEDLDGILDLVVHIRKNGRRFSRRKVKLNVALSSFVPKANTPFQWEPMDSFNELQRKQEDLKRRLRAQKADVKWNDVRSSYLEGVFARGDRRLSRVLMEAHALGAKFDGWHEHFDFSIWTKAFEKANIDPEFYLYRTRTEQEVLPWDHLRTGISKHYLWQERLKALQENETAPCDRHCRRCGLCSDDLYQIDSAPVSNAQKESPATNGARSEQEAPAEHRRVENLPKAFRLRVMFTKTGLLRFLSHRELVRMFQRAASRLNAPLAYSQGFHPHPQISFGPALPVGGEGLRELVDFFFTEAVAVEQFASNMNDTLPSDVRVLEAFPVELKAPSLSAELRRFIIRVSSTEDLVQQGFDLSFFRTCLDEFHSREEFFVETFKKRTEAVDIRPYITVLEFHPDERGLPCVEMTLDTHQNVMMKPEEVLHLVCGIPYEKILDFRITRIAMETKN
ncbi:MAG: TIGR03960 family B12-binding radical SAM protein [bacterium]|nr:TIGR03960 family B12-binding radical SAM protein [bacterium]